MAKNLRVVTGASNPRMPASTRRRNQTVHAQPAFGERGARSVAGVLSMESLAGTDLGSLKRADNETLIQMTGGASAFPLWRPPLPPGPHQRLHPEGPCFLRLCTWAPGWPGWVGIWSGCAPSGKFLHFSEQQ